MLSVTARAGREGFPEEAMFMLDGRERLSRQGEKTMSEEVATYAKVWSGKQQDVAEEMEVVVC